MDASPSSSPPSQNLSVRSYTPSTPTGPFPYTAQDLRPHDAGRDASFYRESRFVTHIDDNAIINLRVYYDNVLPKAPGSRILDFCSSWISHYPPSVEQAVQDEDVQVWGTGMNREELKGNPVLNVKASSSSAGDDGESGKRGGSQVVGRWWVQDLNDDPTLKFPESAGSEATLDASTCVVSIDYLTQPVQVLESIRQHTKPGGKVHLIISNRCFPTKVVRRWLQVKESERLEMVGDYLWWSGWRNIEIVEVVKSSWMKDPLWVVRATNVQEQT